MLSSKVERIKNQIVATCKECGGAICAKCELKSSRIEKYSEANIPVGYWLLPFKNFKGDKNFNDIIKEKLKDINRVYDQGKSMLFVGNLGTGKTFAASSILKMAIVSGYTARYTTMADIVSAVTSGAQSSSYISDLMGYDFLVIDEFDARWIFPSEKAEHMFGSILENLLRNRFQNQLPTVLCSNTEDPDQILTGQFAKAFKSLRSQHLDVIYVGGKDFRRIINND